MPNVISSIYGANRDLFGHQDYVQAVDSGVSHQRIQEAMDAGTLNIAASNQTLRDQITANNVDRSLAQATPYGGGSQQSNQQNNNISEQWAQMQSAFDDSMRNYLESNQQWQQQQQSRQQAFQSQQLAQQQAHQDRMLAAQQRVRGSASTAVKTGQAQLAIGQGRVAAPQSASSLARKPTGGSSPVVSGLNISGNSFKNPGSLGIRG